MNGIKENKNANQPIVAKIEALVDKILAITKDSDYPENPTKQASYLEKNS